MYCSNDWFYEPVFNENHKHYGTDADSHTLLCGLISSPQMNHLQMLCCYPTMLTCLDEEVRHWGRNWRTALCLWMTYISIPNICGCEINAGNRGQPRQKALNTSELWISRRCCTEAFRWRPIVDASCTQGVLVGLRGINDWKLFPKNNYMTT